MPPPQEAQPQTVVGFPERQSLSARDAAKPRREQSVARMFIPSVSLHHGYRARGHIEVAVLHRELVRAEQLEPDGVFTCKPT
jgi:hypothetical protein